MRDTVVKVEELFKQYRLGYIGTGSVAHDLNRWWHRIQGRQDPYSKIAETNVRNKKGSSQYVWALQGVNFEINRGDAVGIIGRNGAGKSTLLKVLSRTTSPTRGKIKIKGKIASLLEVGTGFHPDLSGRENVFLNGAILGMRKAEIKKKFDEIVDFAGIERFIDTPVKRYSSGMYVRLAFGVAAHLEPDILIVDEVLAVGDSEFQKKALGKMQDVSKTDGRTVIFVSHNMTAIQNLCNKGILMSQGTIHCEGEISTVLKEYINSGNVNTKEYIVDDDIKKRIQILKARVVDKYDVPTSEFSRADSIYFKFDIKNTSVEKDIRYNVALYDSLDRMIMVDSYYVHSNPGYQSFKVSVPTELLTPTSFRIGLSIDIPSVELLDILPEKLNIDILNDGSKIGVRGDTDFGILMPKFIWQEEK